MIEQEKTVNLSQILPNCPLEDYPENEGEGDMNLNEKYVEGYNNEFARKSIVSDECRDRLSFVARQNSCSYRQINDWTQRWMFENGGMQISEDTKPPIKLKTTFNL